MIRIHSPQKSPHVLELDGVLESSDLPPLASAIQKCPPNTCDTVLDFSKVRIPEALWPELERSLLRWHTRNSGELWFTGLKAREHWNHAETTVAIFQLLSQAELAWARISEWRERRLEEIQTKITALLQASDPPQLERLRSRAQTLKILRHTQQAIELEQKRPHPQDGSAQISHSAARLEEKVLLALASQGVTP